MIVPALRTCCRLPKRNCGLGPADTVFSQVQAQHSTSQTALPCFPVLLTWDVPVAPPVDDIVPNTEDLREVWMTSVKFLYFSRAETCKAVCKLTHTHAARQTPRIRPITFAITPV